MYGKIENWKLKIENYFSKTKQFETFIYENSLSGFDFYNNQSLIRLFLNK